MDAKYPSNLDPKLKEAYERVMGLSTPSKTQSSANPAQQPVQQQPPPPQPEAPAQSTSMKMVTEEVHMPETKHDKPTVVHLDGNDEKAKATTNTQTQTQAPAQKSSSMMAVVLGIIAVLFFIGYALFWAQILGMDILPF